MRKFAVILVLVTLALIQGCSSKGDRDPDPRQVVLNMLREMEKGDEEARKALVHYLDFPSLLMPRKGDYALQMDSVRSFRNPEAILDDLTEGGLTRERWLSMQRVVGGTEQTGDSALVEVSFNNKNTGTQYYNKWGLRKINGLWKVYSFHTLDLEDF